MKKFLSLLVLFCAVFLLESCGCDKKKTVYDYSEADTPDADTEGEAEEICGTLGIKCCYYRICEDGLVCDPDLNVCIEADEEEDDDENGIGIGGGGGKEENPNPCEPNPCLETANSTEFCRAINETTFYCVCKTNYSWKEWSKTCEPDSITTNCQGLPENAEWNVTSTIHQEWNGTAWVPSGTGTYNPEASTTECRFKCRENYDWTGDTCKAGTRDAECTGLPANAEWNTVSSITQHWNGYSWEPDTTGTFSKTPATDRCRYMCSDGYFPNSATNECINPCKCSIPHSNGVCSATDYKTYTCGCDENYIWNASSKTCDAKTQTVRCTGLPTNAEWNTSTTQFTQEWNGTEWYPSAESYYNEAPGANDCRFKCKENYDWNASAKTCDKGKKETECKRLPDNAVWNTAESIMQEWNGSSWTPTDIGSYSTTPKTDRCVFKCIDDYHWEIENEEYACLYNQRTGECTGLPENAAWNTTDRIDQTWNGSSWTPDKTGKYNPTPSGKECRFICGTGYFWNGSECADNPCGCSNDVSCENKSCDIPNATGVCISKGAEKYECECEEGFYWWEESGCSDKKPLTLGNICTAQEKCYNTYSEITCPGSAEEAFYGQDAQYAALGTCTQHGFTAKPAASDIIVFDKNTGLEWQRVASSSKYTWEGAKDYCTGLLYGGHTGWRLPTPHELLTIVDNGKYPTLDTSYFTNLAASGSSSVLYWTSKELKYNTDKAFEVSVYSGTVKTEHLKLDGENRVICVWGNELPTASFSTETVGEDEDEAEVVVDSTTGLMWQKSFVPGKSWENALSYCEASTEGGFSDWRLPNKNELLSLANFDMHSPASEFPDMPSNDTNFWSSSYLPSSPSYVYTINFRYGTTESKSKSSSQSSFAVRCVRNN